MPKWLSEVVKTSWADGGIGACTVWHQHEVEHRPGHTHCLCVCHQEVNVK